MTAPPEPVVTLPASDLLSALGEPPTDPLDRELWDELAATAVAWALADPAGFEAAFTAALSGDDVARAAPTPIGPKDHEDALAVRATIRDRWAAVDPAPTQPIATAMRHCTSRLDLANHLEAARAANQPIRPLGTYRSLSDAAPFPGATGVLLGLSRLNEHVLDRATNTVRVGPGCTVGSLSMALAEPADGGAPLCLPALGAGDFQTVIGAVSTGTHGAGYGLTDLTGLVRQLEIVGFDVTGALVHRTCRPSGAVELPKGEPVPGAIPLSIADDDLFHAALVSLGCLGVIVSMTLDVVDMIWLAETRTVDTLHDVLQRLSLGEPKGVRHFEVTIDPFPRAPNGPLGCDKLPNKADTAGALDLRRVGCIVSRRADGPHVPKHKRGSRPPGMTVAAGGLAQSVAMGWLQDDLANPLAVARNAHKAIRCTQVADYVDRLPWMLKLGLGVEGTGMEVTVPWRHADGAVRRVMEIIWRRWKALVAAGGTQTAWRAHAVPTATVNLRPVKRSPALLSMAHATAAGDEAFLAIEILGILDREPPKNGPAANRYAAYVEGYKAMFAEVEQALCAQFEGRPHWGLESSSDAAVVAAAWPTTWPTWLAARQVLDPLRAFRSRMSDRLAP